MIVYAGVMVVVYALGAPLLYAYLLFRRFGKPLQRIKDIEARYHYLQLNANAKDQYNRFDKATSELATLAPTNSDSVADEVVALKIEEAGLRAELPTYIRSLSGNGYAKRAFFFEIIECVPSHLAFILRYFFFVLSSTQLPTCPPFLLSFFLPLLLQVPPQAAHRLRASLV